VGWVVVEGDSVGCKVVVGDEVGSLVRKGGSVGDPVVGAGVVIRCVLSTPINTPINKNKAKISCIAFTLNLKVQI
jgi:hypothetical protein